MQQTVCTERNNAEFTYLKTHKVPLMKKMASVENGSHFRNDKIRKKTEIAKTGRVNYNKHRQEIV